MKLGGQLQEAMYRALIAEPLVAPVYDRPPADAPLPYITIGDEQAIDDGNSCSDAWEVFADVHVWSPAVKGSKLEVKRFMASVEERLAVELDVSGFTVLSGTLDSKRSFRDPDGFTEHGVLTFRFLIDPAS